MQVPFQRIIPAAAITIFLVLAVSSARTNRPQIDEGMFASPAYNLAFNGFFGTTVLEKEQASLTRIDERTYWVMPLFLLNVAASFKAFGFSIFTIRLVSIFWGVILLLSIYAIAWKMSRDRIVALFALCLASCDYMVLETGSSGRMDMMSAALGFAAIAVYLLLRENRLLLAVLLSQTVVVLDGLTHPNGIMAFVGVLVLTIYFDRRRLSLPVVLAALAPYAVGGLCYGLWVFQDPTAFKEQFIDNATMGGRMSAFSAPLDNILREFTERYPHAFGMQGNSSGHTGPIYLKGLMLIGYIAGLIGVLAVKELRSNRNYRILLVVTGLYFLIVAFIDGQKETPYLIQIVPLYLIFLAALLGWLWKERFFQRPFVLAVAACFMLLPAAGMSYRVSQNTYGNFYLPMIHYLKQNMGPDDYVMGGAELAFGLGFESNIIADGRFGFYTGKRPRYIVYDSSVEISWRDSKMFFPAFYDYFPKLLADEYKVAFENAGFTVYEHK
jgi:4-amino-4-deoxy-L-arabinose transferase-like glycosyltransferase